MICTSMESLAKVRVNPTNNSGASNVNGCSGCIPSNHHATVLEGCGGEGKCERETTYFMLTI